ncbi:MAG: virulence factor SrfB [Planctomycetes bacterium]|nr:virulence factor SrfB [Planctomycetota bacterium]
MTVHRVFSNTGVQCICEPLPLPRGTHVQDSKGWQYCQCLEANGQSARTYHYLQWQVIADRMFFAIDTTCGAQEHGYFQSADAHTADFLISISPYSLIGPTGQTLAGLPAGLPPVEIAICSASANAGGAIGVHLVVDFGNSRTGALMIEHSDERNPVMEPFELQNRYRMDVWNLKGEFRKRPTNRWFSSRTRWSMSPYLSPSRIEKEIFTSATRKGFLGRRTERGSYLVFVHPRLFQDLSAVRLGQEGDDVTQIMQIDGIARTGVSSPKRFLWADDESWLEGALWRLADPSDRCGTQEYAATLRGPLFRYLDETDPDELTLPASNDEIIPEEELARECPFQPRHAPRILMVAALYELLCQTYTYLNSNGYRQSTPEPNRTREILSLSLSHPTGMIAPERERFQKQAQKAADLFFATLGRRQQTKPSVSLSIDEASAVHLTYIWSELQATDLNAKLWFGMVGRNRATESSTTQGGHAAAGSEAASTSDDDEPIGPARPTVRFARKLPQASTAVAAPDREVRVACIDIGGGTTDLMIAKYVLKSGLADSIQGDVLHQDGISLAGDLLVKRLLECLIVPQFAAAVGLKPHRAIELFGPATPSMRRFQAQRINWLNRLFVPLAQAYLQQAVDGGAADPISHTDARCVDPDIVDGLQSTIDEIYEVGRINVHQPLDLIYDEELFNEIVHNVFDDLLYDFCQRIVKHDVDVVLLAGQPTKLKYIQRLVKTYLPLPSSRVIPMHNYYAGTWYPYPEDIEKGFDPGTIKDPKSAVAVGTAVQLLLRRGLLGGVRFEMRNEPVKNSYHWGVVWGGSMKIAGDRILFAREDKQTQTTRIPINTQRVVIARRASDNVEAEASPIYMVRVVAGPDVLNIDATLTVKRRLATRDEEERLEPVDVEGTVGEEPAVLGKNVLFSWRTLSDQSFYLDTGALDSIELTR